jgi:AcrR family transcriptional regulator
MAERAASVWTRPPRAKRDQPTLDREQIVDAAVELLDAEGLDGLSMRRLGTKLNSGATTVYWHVANKDELLELALDRAMAEVTVPSPDEDGWRAAATAFAHSLRAMIHRHPWTVTLFGSAPMIGPNSTRMVDRLLTVFTRAGFSGLGLEYAWSLLNDWVVGAAGSEAIWKRTNPDFSWSDWAEVSAPYLEQTAKSHPQVVDHQREVWSSGDWERVLDEKFAFGLDCLLDGVAARLPGR